MRRFRRRVDVRPIYGACMKDGGQPRMSAADAAAARDSPFSMYCRYHADLAKKDPPDPFLEELSAKVVEHGLGVLESDYPEMEQVSYETPEEDFMEALRCYGRQHDFKIYKMKHPTFPDGLRAGTRRVRESSAATTCATTATRHTSQWTRPSGTGLCHTVQAQAGQGPDSRAAGIQ